MIFEEKTFSISVKITKKTQKKKSPTVELSKTTGTFEKF